jgi:hypothetical protein
MNGASGLSAMTLRFLDVIARTYLNIPHEPRF